MRHDMFQILAVLHAGAAEAAEILEQVDRMGARAPSVPTLYRRLKEGADAGWIEVDTGRADAPGRPGHRYTLTRAGAAAAKTAAESWRAYTELVLGVEGSA